MFSTKDARSVSWYLQRSVYLVKHFQYVKYTKWINKAKGMDSSTSFQAPPQAAYSLWSCDKVYYKQEVCFLLYVLGQIVSWQYNPNMLDWNWPCTIINDHDWQLWNCPLHKGTTIVWYANKNHIATSKENVNCFKWYFSVSLLAKEIKPTLNICRPLVAPLYVHNQT